jgi:putative acetyltransferase
MRRGRYLLAQEDGQIIGELTCRRKSGRMFAHIVTLSMSVARERRNKGVGSQLITDAMAWADGNEAVKRIELKVYAENSAAIRLYQKFGFEVEGCRRKAVFQRGRFHDVLMMARLMH